jgi:hypothetical protein
MATVMAVEGDLLHVGLPGSSSIVTRNARALLSPDFARAHAANVFVHIAGWHRARKRCSQGCDGLRGEQPVERPVVRLRELEDGVAERTIVAERDLSLALCKPVVFPENLASRVAALLALG